MLRRVKAGGASGLAARFGNGPAPAASPTRKTNVVITSRIVSLDLAQPRTAARGAGWIFLLKIKCRD